MKNFIQKFKYAILGGLFLVAGSVLAVQISVPSAPIVSIPGAYMLQSTSTGQWVATSTQNIYAGSFTATSTSATSTIANALRISGQGTATAKDNALQVDASGRIFPASISVGGAVNINENTQSQFPALVLYGNGSGAGTGRLFSAVQEGSATTQDMMIASSACANCTTANFKGGPSGKGVVKIETTSGSGDSNASALSIDIQGGGTTAAQGIFMDATNGATTGNLLNLRNNGAVKLTLSPNGLLTTPYSTSTIYSSFITASSTNFVGGGLGTCTGSSFLQYSATGFFGCAAAGTTFTGAINSIVTTNGSGNLIATGSQLTVGNILATSTTATSTFLGPISMFGFNLSTSTTVCIWPEMCQYQVPSGATNADVVMNAAISYINGIGGGTVYFKKGIYTLNATVSLLASTTVTGEGDGTTIICPTVGGGTKCFQVLNQHNITVQGFNFDGRNQISSFGSNDKSINIRNAYDVRIMNNTFTNTNGFAIVVDSQSGGFASTTGVIVSNNTLHCNAHQDCIGGGANQPAGSSTTTDVSIIGNHIFQTNASSGVENVSADVNCIDFTGIANTDIADNICHGNILVGVDNYPNTYTKVTGNLVFSPYGPRLTNGDIDIRNDNVVAGFVNQNIIISGNIVSAGKIDFTGSSAVPLTGLIISNNSLVTGSSTSQNYGNPNAQQTGIYVSQAVNPLITGNQIEAFSSLSTSTGIILSSVTNGTVSNNTIKNFAGSGGTCVNLNSGSGNTSSLNTYINCATNESGVTNSLQFTGGNLGVGTSSPGSIFSIGTTGTGVNFFDNGTTTYSGKGINLLNGGCFAIKGVCVGGSGGSGTVTSVGLSLPSFFTITNSPVTTTGTLTGAISQPINSILTTDSAGTNIIATGSQLTIGTLLATTTWGVATSSIINALGIGTVAPNGNMLRITTPATTSASITVGGVVNIRNAFDGAGLVVYKTGSASDTGRMVVFNQDSLTDVQDMILASSSCANCTALNLKGDPTGKGILKIEETGSGTGFSNGSAVSIDMSNETDSQGIFVKGAVSGTGKLLNLVDSNSATLGFFDSTGLLNFKYSTSTIYSSFVTASTTNFIINGSNFNNLLGSGLSISGGALTIGTGAITDSMLASTFIKTYDVFTHLLFGGANSASFSATTSQMAISTSSAPTNIAALTISSSTKAQIALSAGAGNPMWYFANSIGNLFIGTTTVIGTATSSPILSLITATGNVGIGTTTPYGLFALDTSAMQTNPIISIGSSVGGSSLLIATSAQALLMVGTTSPFSLNPNTSPLTQTASGKVVISTTTTAQISLTGGTTDNAVNFRSIGGAFYIGTTTSLSQATTTLAQLGFNTAGQIIFGDYANCSGTTNALGVTSGIVLCDSLTSDGRLKKNIVPLSDGLTTVMSLKPVSFYWKDLTNHNTTSPLEQYGFIAQDVQKILPSAVDHSPDGYLTLDKTMLISPIVSAIQSLYTDFQKLVVRISGLETKVNQQQKEIDVLTARLNKLENK